MKKKNTILEIDEEAIIESFVTSNLKAKRHPLPATKTPENDADSQKKESVEKYVAMFLKRTVLQNRKGIYISGDNHRLITQILKYVDHEISLSRYINNVLEAHFNMYKEEILDFIRSKEDEEYKKLIDFLTNEC